MGVEHCRLIELPRFEDERGSLSFIHAGEHVPFIFQRVYFLYDLPPGATRGAHGHKELEQLMIPISGSFDVILDDGSQKRSVHLDKPNQALYICPMIWRDLCNFSQGAVCLVLASEKYNEADYYREYGDFIEALRQ